MGILRSAPGLDWGAGFAAEEGGAADGGKKLAARTTPGMDAANKPVPVAARKFLRPMRDDLREFFMRSPRRRRRYASPGGIIRCFLRRQLCSSQGMQSGKGRNGSGYGEHSLRRPLLLLHGLDQHLDRLTGVGRNENGGGKQAAEHPGLAGFGKAVATGEGQFQPAFTVGFAGQFLEGFASADGHRIILSGNEVHGGFLRGGELEPGAYGALRAFFGPLRAQRDDLDVGRLGLLHAQGTFLGRGVFRRALNVQHRAPARQQRSELAPLNAANLDVIGTDGENRGAGDPAEVFDVIGIAIENGPTDIGSGGRASHLGQGGAADGLENDGTGPVRGRRLNGAEDLGALVDGVVIGVDNVGGDAHFIGGLFGGLSLLHLIIVVVSGERNENSHLCHWPAPAPSKQPYTESFRDGEKWRTPRPAGHYARAQHAKEGTKAGRMQSGNGRSGSPDGSRTRNLHLERVTS